MTLKSYANMTGKSVKLKLPDEAYTHDIVGQKMDEHLKKMFVELLLWASPDDNRTHIINIEEAQNESTHPKT